MAVNFHRHKKNSRGFYSKLLNIVKDNEALSTGDFYELMIANEHQPGFDTMLYIYMRYTAQQKVLVVANFNRTERAINIQLPVELLTQFGLSGAHNFTDLLSGDTFSTADIYAGVFGLIIA
jgi:glycosidase